MKIAPKFFSKETLIKKLDKRNARRIENYILVSDNLAPKKTEQVKQYADSLARFAEKKGCILEFTPGEDVFKNSTQMNVYKKYLGVIRSSDGLPCMAFDGRSLSGKVIVPEDGVNNKSVIDSLKSSVKSVIAKDKNWYNKFVDFN